MLNDFLFESYLLQSRVIEKESKKTDEKGRVRADIYRVSHSKEGKVILLW